MNIEAKKMNIDIEKVNIEEKDANIDVLQIYSDELTGLLYPFLLILLSAPI